MIDLMVATVPLLLFIGGWVLLQAVILPRLGVGT